MKIFKIIGKSPSTTLLGVKENNLCRRVFFLDEKTVISTHKIIGQSNNESTFPEVQARH
jgi:hypothetical protein